MFQALLCPSSGARDYDVFYHIGRFFLGLLYVGGLVRLGWSSVWVAGSSTDINIYRVSQEECARLRESVPYVKVYRYNPKHLCPKLNGYGDNGQRSLKL